MFKIHFHPNTLEIDNDGHIILVKLSAITSVVKTVDNLHLRYGVERVINITAVNMLRCEEYLIGSKNEHEALQKLFVMLRDAMITTHNEKAK